MLNYKEQIIQLLAKPEELIKKKPFTRGSKGGNNTYYPKYLGIGEKISMPLPSFQRIIVPQERFLRELDPNCHDVLFDENIPSICVKIENGGYRDIKYNRMSIPLQELIKSQQLIYLTTHKMQFTQVDLEPTETQNKNFVTFRQYWDLRNQDGMKNRMVDIQLSTGDAGLLYYFDYKGEIKSRTLSFSDGYVLCPHNDQNGDRILESVYYVKDDIEYIDSYDNTYMYRWTKNDYAELASDTGWKWHTPIIHGFEEIPLITKRGKVAWDNVQPIIEAYEELYNVFNAIQKRFGWGIFYIKGKFKDKGQRIAGSVVLNDTSMEGKGEAKFLTPPTPDGMMDTLKNLLRTIQLGASTTFILPDDIRMSGDVSGLAVQLTKELDLQNAMQKVIDWQNVADKMTRLFKYGLAKELVNKGINPQAITEFEDLHINAQFKVWKPFNDMEYNSMVSMLVGAGILSKQTGVEINTLSKPDEQMRIEKQEMNSENNNGNNKQDDTNAEGDASE